MHSLANYYYKLDYKNKWAPVAAIATTGSFTRCQWTRGYQSGREPQSHDCRFWGWNLVAQHSLPHRFSSTLILDQLPRTIPKKYCYVYIIFTLLKYHHLKKFCLRYWNQICYDQWWRNKLYLYTINHQYCLSSISSSWVLVFPMMGTFSWLWHPTEPPQDKMLLMSLLICSSGVDFI